MTCDEVFALQPEITGSDQTTLEYAKNFAPGSRTVIIFYGRIPGYRDPKRKSWGFAISDKSATWSWYEQHTCSRREAKKTFETLLKPKAEERGFKVELILEEGCGLNPDLTVA